MEAGQMKTGGVPVWFQTMSDFHGSPVDGQAARQTVEVRLAASSEEMSITLSNVYGDHELLLERVAVTGGFQETFLTFGGRSVCAIPAGQTVESDRFGVEMGDSGILRITLIPRKGQRAAAYGSSIDRTMIRVLGAASETPQYYYGLQAVTAYGIDHLRPIALFGDSLTNQGRYSGPVSVSLLGRHDGLSIFNCGISGNRLLHDGAGESLWASSFGPSGVKRFEEDVTLGHRVAPEAIFVLMGVNDLFQAGGTAPAHQLPSSSDILLGFKRLASLGRGLGAKLILGTITPFRGSVSHEMAAWSLEKEAVRRHVNDALRTGWWSLCDALVDADAIVRDASDQTRLANAFDCGDHLHFSKAGGEEVARHVVRALLKVLD